jgi:2-oxoisovalerate dehydrogenase E1 component
MGSGSSDRELTCPAAGGNVRDDLNTALATLLEQRPEVIVLGEDIHAPYGGAFKVTGDLSARFPTRVVSTPISEAGSAGAAIGLALAGRRPILEIMFADFLTLCADQLLNQAVKLPFLSPDTRVPLVIRTPSGGYRGYGPTHSQSPEGILTSIPGLTVVCGSHRHAVGQLLVDAVLSWPHPTLFFEHKLLYGRPREEADYRALDSGPDEGIHLFPTLVRRPVGEPDLTILTFGGLLPEVETVTTILEEEEELAVELVVPALLSPFPVQSTLSPLVNRSKILVVEEPHTSFGVGAEIVAQLAESGFAGRVERVGAPPLPIPAARSLERDVLPTREKILESARALFE